MLAVVKMLARAWWVSISHHTPKEFLVRLIHLIHIFHLNIPCRISTLFNHKFDGWAPINSRVAWNHRHARNWWWWRTWHWWWRRTPLWRRTRFCNLNDRAETDPRNRSWRLARVGLETQRRTRGRGELLADVRTRHDWLWKEGGTALRHLVQDVDVG